MGRTKILMLATDLEVGGVPLHLKQLACSLDPDQFEVQVACLSSSGPIAVGTAFVRNGHEQLLFCFTFVFGRL